MSNQPIAIVKTTEDAFSEFGVTSRSSENYIKLSTSLRQSGLIKLLRGSRLHIFIIIALHEADDAPGASLHTLHAETGISIPTIIASLKFLEHKDHPFIRHIGFDPDGTKRYRPCSLAWHGKDASRANGSKEILDPARGGSKETLLPKKISSIYDDSTLSELNSGTHHHISSSAQKIFADCGFAGPNLL